MEKFPGVYKKYGKWRAEKKYKQQRYDLGEFNSQEDAWQAIVEFCEQENLPLPRSIRNSKDIYRYNPAGAVTEILCNKCKKWLNIKRFSRNNNRSKYGLRTTCKSCLSDQNSERASSLAQPENQLVFTFPEGICFVCEKNQATFVDRNSSSGYLRLLICTSCSSALELMGENPVAIRRLMNVASACQALKGNLEVSEKP